MKVRRWIAGQVRSPTAVGGVVASTAFVFSSTYLFLWPEVAMWVKGVPPMGLVPLITLNAFLSATVVWKYGVGEAKPITQKRLAGVGLGIGVVSHVGLGMIAASAFVLFDENGLLVEGLPALAEIPGMLGAWAGMSLFVGLYSIFLTFGIPVLLSVGVGVVFARAS